MSMRRVISIPLGNYTATCTIDVPQDAIAVVINGKTIAAIADDIAATIDRATRSPAEPISKEAKSVAKTAVGDDHPSDDEDVYPILDPRLETVTPTGAKPTLEPIQIFIRDVNGTTGTYLVQPEVELERLLEAYAARRRVPLETCRFTFAGRQLDWSRSAADYGMREFSTIWMVMRLVGS
ncbi:isg15 ubiquitin-like modifier [Teratosphaeriaceae sp. CCFEE 6253]|nr:isg15 ubiquitin-like modifier [Teratosphaeriaceae sp. CCFEE 6253]